MPPSQTEHHVKSLSFNNSLISAIRSVTLLLAARHFSCSERAWVKFSLSHSSNVWSGFRERTFVLCRKIEWYKTSSSNSTWLGFRLSSALILLGWTDWVFIPLLITYSKCVLRKSICWNSWYSASRTSVGSNKTDTDLAFIQLIMKSRKKNFLHLQLAFIVFSFQVKRDCKFRQTWHFVIQLI